MALQLVAVLRAIGNDSRVTIGDDRGRTEYIIEYDVKSIEDNGKRNQFNLFPDEIVSVQAISTQPFDVTVANTEYLANSYSSRNFVAGGQGGPMGPR